MNVNPLVSIIIPTYNRAHLIIQTLDSILAQTYENWECLVVDDGSTDKTIEIVNKYSSRDNRFKYLINNRTKGAQGARNTGIINAKGEFIQFLDSDDFLDSTKIDKQISAFSKNTTLEMVFCLSEYVQREQDEIIKKGIFWNQNQETQDYIFAFLMDNPVFHTNEPLWKASTIKKIGFWDEQLCCWQDWEYHIRALSLKIEYSYLNEVLSFIDDTPKKVNSITGYSEFKKLDSRIKAGIIVEKELQKLENKIYKRGLCFHFILISKDSLRLKNYHLTTLCQDFIFTNHSNYKIYLTSGLMKILLKFYKNQNALNSILNYQYKTINNNYKSTWKLAKIK